MEEHKQLLKDPVNINSYTPDNVDVDRIGACIRDFAQSCADRPIEFIMIGDEELNDRAQITYNCGMFTGGTSPNTVPVEAIFTLYNR